MDKEQITTLEQLERCIKNRTPLLFGYNEFHYGCIVNEISIDDTISYFWELQDAIIEEKRNKPTLEELIEYIKSTLDNPKDNPLLYLFLNTTECVEMYDNWNYETNEYSPYIHMIPVKSDFEFWNDSDSGNGIRPGDSDFIRTMDLEELKNYTAKVKKIKRKYGKNFFIE